MLYRPLYVNGNWKKRLWDKESSLGLKETYLTGRFAGLTYKKLQDDR